ncbi:MAG TPA: tetratricopeptide repeat protein, partial [Anaerolineae bacterium]|nr:tetratricopeptide repeat protein [Anaerolineae bacterium]
MAKDRIRYEKAYRAGLAFNKSGQYPKAFNAFRVAINEFPRDPAAYAGLGETCLNLKQLDRALECYKLAARYSRGDLSYLQKVADIQERQGQLNEAARTYMAVGELLLKRQEIDEAIGNWQRAIRLDPTLLGAHRRLAMVFQRQDKKRDAVREYLAIARILQMRGENKKAMQMCRAAMRLDPGNDDVLTAMELIRHGEAAFAEAEQEEAEPPVSPEEQEEADQLTQTVRQMAAAFEAERKQPAAQAAAAAGPVEAARHLAQEQLAEEIFRDEDDDEADSDAPLSKLERDAALGQGMDFEQRGQIGEAIDSYRKAIEGGLRLPAAYFTIGLLYLENQQPDEARQMLSLAAQDPAYKKACQAAL